jgi:hypothetical protein
MQPTFKSEQVDKKAVEVKKKRTFNISLKEEYQKLLLRRMEGHKWYYYLLATNC